MGPGTCHDQNPLAGIAGVGLLRLLEECVERMLETGLFQPEPSLAPPSPLQEGRKSRGHGSRSARRRPGDALAFASPGGARRNGCHLSGGAVSTLSYWADHIPRGDQACAADPEGLSQKGTMESTCPLFCTNQLNKRSGCMSLVSVPAKPPRRQRNRMQCFSATACVTTDDV